MRIEIVLTIVIAAGAAMVARHVDRNYVNAPAPVAAADAEVEENAPTPSLATARWGREVRVKAARDMHFYIDAGVNRRTMTFLVDTGASFVALRESDARASGLYILAADFTYPVRTANGETMAAMVMLDEIAINGIRIDGVKAFVLRDEQLAVNLLGMSFLNRLESVEARNGELILRG